MIKNGYDDLMTSIRANIPKNHGVFSFGKAYNKNLLLIGPSEKREKRILIVGGFHGNEIAGPLAIGQYIKNNKKTLEKSNVGVYFIPICNIGGFINGTRYNISGDASNFFCDKEGKYTVKLSVESQLIMNEMKKIQMISKDGILSCHENESLNSYFYIYMYGSDKKLAKKLLEAGSMHFSIRKDGAYSDVGLIKNIVDSEQYNIKDGLITTDADGSFEFCLNKHGSEVGVTVETPMKNSLEERIDCQIDFIETFIKHIEGKK